jgi:hypothetical protein
MHWE